MIKNNQLWHNFSERVRGSVNELSKKMTAQEASTVLKRRVIEEILKLNRAIREEILWLQAVVTLLQTSEEKEIWEEIKREYWQYVLGVSH
jgi:hypothetical protein